MKKKNMEIERLRAIAVLGVMIAHSHFLHDFFPPVLRLGWTGVDLFFVISGYVVSLSFLGSLPLLPEDSQFFERLKLSFKALKNFYYKRIARILPMATLWAIIPLTLIHFSIQEEYNSLHFIDLVREFTSIMTFTYNYFYIFHYVPRLLGHYWSLSVEEQFYFILPLFFIFVPTNFKRIKWLLTLSVLIAFVLRFISAPAMIASGEDSWAWVRFASHNRFDALCIGVMLYIVHKETDFKKYFSPGRLQVWIISLICIAGIFVVPGIFMDSGADRFNHLLFALMSAVLVILATLETDYLLNIKFVTPVFNWMGSRSYGLYLIHVPAEIMVKEYVRRGNDLSMNQMAGVWILLTIILVELSYRLLEKPVISWARKFSV